ncbi:MAG: poly-gamma-glutamate synthase PgsB, partial [Candidatus Hydrothermia bacterium]
MWLVLVILTLLYVCYGIIEWNMHKKNLGMIPTRIVVNGTRGKSTVTRLVAAGLVGGGFRVMAKTTGTKPNIIINNEQEIPVVRLGRANIKEQLSIFKRAVNERVDAIVFENMSLRPDLQIMEESKIIQPQFVVITNVRQDHLDVMGPTPVDIVRNFINAVPQGSTVFTAENDLFPVMSEYAERKGIKLIKASEEEVEPEEMAKFPYVEHRENVALALKVCAFLGIPRERALNEMYRYIPDPGVLKKYVLNFSGKKAVLY